MLFKVKNREFNINYLPLTGFDPTTFLVEHNSKKNIPQPILNKKKYFFPKKVPKVKTYSLKGNTTVCTYRVKLRMLVYM
jgi:hypothetical protein